MEKNAAITRIECVIKVHTEMWMEESEKKESN